MIYSPAEAPIELAIYDCELVKRGQGQRKKYQERQYIDAVCAFDIETTTLHFPATEENKHNDHSFMYVWQFQFSDKITVVGRTWEEYIDFCNRIENALYNYSVENGLREKPYLVLFVHNLQFEFQFLRGIFTFHPEDVFFRQARKPIYARWNNCIEYRCSYIQSNMSLEKFAQTMGAAVQKKSGFEFDYFKVRYPWTELTDAEIDYCISDVISLVQSIQIEMQRDGDNLRTIPLTSTGYVRRDCKKALYKKRKFIETMLPKLGEFQLLRQAMRGGNTHANRFLVNTIYKNVDSYDMTSCYPAQQLTKKFPMKRFKELLPPVKAETVFRMINQDYAVVARYQFWNLRLANVNTPIPYLSRSKCDALEVVEDNGRILSCSYCETSMTEIDLKIVLRQYSFDNMRIEKAIAAKKDYLPQEYRDCILNYYRLKTQLKGVEGEDNEYLYMKSKNKLNSVYGMSCQDILHETIEYAPDADPPYKQGECSDKEKRYKLSKASFPYGWGLYTVSYGREALQEAIDLAGDSIIYCDTDSVKTIRPIDLTALNKKREELAEKMGAYADNRQGQRFYMGVFEFEGRYDEFITQGAKRYAFVKNGHMGITVSGVTHKRNPKTGNQFACDELRSLDNFRDGFTFTDAGGNAAIYNDTDDFVYHTEEGDVHITPNIAIIPSTYTLGYSKSYKALLQGLKLWSEYKKELE